MTPLPLNNNFSFDMEMHDGRPRLVIYQGAEEYVCRKESFSNLEKFMAAQSAHIFSGRLQLYRDGSSIRVEVKGAVVGNILVEYFRSRLHALKTP